MLKRPLLFQNGYHVSYFPLGEEIKKLVQEEKYEELNKIFNRQTSVGGSLFEFIQAHHDISKIEIMISVRDANNDWEEDGIWHDDGSRVFAFSLSLTLDEIEGGRLGIRKIGDKISTMIPTPSFGGIILFLTGVYGFEHRIHQVAKGKRVILVGWCS